MSNSDALYNAAQNGKLEKVNKLLEKGADPNKASTNGSTPLIMASQEGYLSIVETLLGKGADPNKASTNGINTPHYGIS